MVTRHLNQRYLAAEEMAYAGKKVWMLLVMFGLAKAKKVETVYSFCDEAVTSGIARFTT